MEKYCTQLICLVTLVVTNRWDLENTCVNEQNIPYKPSISCSCQGKALCQGAGSFWCFMKSNMHIFEQCSQWQKEWEELLGMIWSVKELRPCRLQPRLLSTLAAPKAYHELMQFRRKPDIDTHVETYLCMKLGGEMRWKMRHMGVIHKFAVWMVIWLGRE